MDKRVDVERKIITVLFADLVGFTPLSESLDAEDVATIQDEYFSAVRETIKRYGGVTEKFIGDAAMAVFGVPRSRDDDAERAVRAGLALINRLTHVTAKLGLVEGTLQLRVGINTGETVVHPEAETAEMLVTGDTVNVAARLQTAAPPGGVMTSETTALTVADSIEFGETIALELKGKSQPVLARVALGVRPHRSRDLALGKLRAPIRGRDAEVRQLFDALEQVRHGGVRRSLIVAPPGVGKSRLVGEFLTRIEAEQSGVLVTRSQCQSDTSSSFEPVAQLLVSGLARIQNIEPAQVDMDLIEQSLHDKLAQAGVTPGRADVVVGLTLALVSPDRTPERHGSAEGSGRREQHFSAWIEALDAIAGDSVAAWLVEDAHWARADTLAFLEAATTTPAPAGRLVLITARPSLLERDLGWEHEDGSRGHHFMQLATLKPLDAAALVESLVGPILPPRVVEEMADRSDGNPLFIEELLRTWISVGILAPADDGWTLTAELGAVGMPTTVQAIYAAQIDDLPNTAREVARLGAVSGRRFPQGCFETLGATDPGAGIEVLSRRTLISGPQLESPIGSTYTFRHALLRDAAYSGLARAERARLHIRMARWLTETAGERAVEVSEAIANHYAESLAASSALTTGVGDGLDRDQTADLAASWFEKAGERALKLTAHDSARALYQRSLDMGAGSRLDRARRWQKLGEATAYAQDMDAGAQCFEQAMSDYRDVHVDPSSSDIDRALARTGYATSADARVEVAIDQLRFQEAIRLAEEALQVVEEGDDLETARLLLGRAWAISAETNDLGALKADVERALELARRFGDAGLERVALSYMAAFSSSEEALSWYDQAQALAEEQGREDQVARTIMSRAAVLVDDQPNAIFPDLERAEAVFQANRSTESIGWVNYWRSEASLVNGDWDRASECALRAIGVGETFAYHRLVVRTWHVLLPIAVARSRVDLLERALSWYEALWARGGNPDSPYARLMFSMANLHFDAATLGREHPAPETVPTHESFAGPWRNPSKCAAIETVLGKWLNMEEFDRVRGALGACTAGQPDDYSSALGRGTHALIHARLLGAEGSREEAAEQARHALQSFRVGDARWWIAKAIRFLESMGGSSEPELREASSIEDALGLGGR